MMLRLGDPAPTSSSSDSSLLRLAGGALGLAVFALVGLAFWSTLSPPPSGIEKHLRGSSKRGKS